MTAKGLRKFGVSKENRRQPIVQTGLFLDDQGIPLSIEEFPGNTLDAQTLRTAMKKTVGTFGMGRFILVADRGMYSGANMQAVREGGIGARQTLDGIGLNAVLSELQVANLGSRKAESCRSCCWGGAGGGEVRAAHDACSQGRRMGSGFLV